MKKVLVLVLSAIVLVSCVKEIEFNGEQTDPKIVINSLVEPGKPVTAYVSKSWFFLDPYSQTESQIPENVQASLYVNDTFIGEMTPYIDTIWTADSSWLDIAYKTMWAFAHPYCPETGDVVRITASANGFDDAEATTSPLPNAPICGISGQKITEWEKYVYFAYGDSEQDTAWCISATVEMTLNLVDPNPGQTDYFRIYINTHGYNYGDDICHFSNTMSYTDPVFSNASMGLDYFGSNIPVFTDQLFDGGSYHVKIPLYVYLTLTDYVDPKFYRERIFVEHLTKEYADYLGTCDQGDDLTQFFSEPIQTYSNVKGGYGIVAGRTMDTLWVNLPLEE